MKSGCPFIKTYDSIKNEGKDNFNNIFVCIGKNHSILFAWDFDL